jgi:homoserine dehydrogenase
MTRISDGMPFSQAVAEAYGKGYTEPDPREDLSGTDVARKALILARYLGIKLELSDIEVEPLFPKTLSNSDPKLFIENLRQLDKEMEEKVLAAAAKGCVLRYVAEIVSPLPLAKGTPHESNSTAAVQKVTVGLKAVSSSGPMGMLRGTDNQVTIHTKRYDLNPLVVTGPGAGAEVTAAGVLGDIIALSQLENLENFENAKYLRARNLPGKRV